MRTMPSAWPTTRPMGWRATFRLAIWSGRGKWRGKSGQATSTSTAQPTSAERRLAATNNRAMVANGAALVSRNTWKSRLWRAGAAEAGCIPSRPGLESEERFPARVRWQRHQAGHKWRMRIGAQQCRRITLAEVGHRAVRNPNLPQVSAEIRQQGLWVGSCPYRTPAVLELMFVAGQIIGLDAVFLPQPVGEHLAFRDVGPEASPQPAARTPMHQVARSALGSSRSTRRSDRRARC